MSYIIKKNSALVNVKLTDNGRKNLAAGKLSFTQFAMGDSEVDYLIDDSATSSILRPVDNNSDIMYFVSSESGNKLVPITNINAIPKEIKQSAYDRGTYYFGSKPTALNEDYYLDQSPYNLRNVVGDEADVKNFYGPTSGRPEVGDYLILKMDYDITTTRTTPVSLPATGEVLEFTTDQTVLTFKIISVDICDPDNGEFSVKVDRDFPKFTNYEKSVAFFYKNNIIEKHLDKPDPVSYWSNNVLSFQLNGVTTYDDVPLWNFNIILMDDMIGLDPTTHKNKSQTKGKAMLGTSVLLKYYEAGMVDKIGVVHYTNNTISNWYGEGFYKNTFKLDLPHVLWHKKQVGSPGAGSDIGYVFVCGNTLKSIDNKIRYYDLVDQEKRKTVVGKVFIDYKICVIEDAELLMAMSIKGNRNWTLPTPKISTTEPGTCLGSSSHGALHDGESLHITYLMYDTAGVTPIHCNNHFTVTIEKGVKSINKDVIFEFPKDPNDPLYTEFGFLRNYDDPTNLGFKANRIAILWQKTDAGEKPNPLMWHIKDVTNYLGTTGCINQNVEVFDEFELATETLISANTEHSLLKSPVGEIIISADGLVKVEANSFLGLSAATPFYFDKGERTLKFHSSINGSLIQIYYLAGNSNTSFSRIQKYITPTTIPSTGTGMYVHGSTGKVSIHLDYQPSNDVVYLFYNGQLIGSNNYSVYNTGPLADRRVELNFIPAQSSNVMIYYIDASATGINPMDSQLTSLNFNNLRVFIDKDFLDNSADTTYNIKDFIRIPEITSQGVTFGDEEFLLGNVITDIKATIFKSAMTCNVLPNSFVTSTNPTWNANQDKVQFSEIGIYDEDNDMVAIGKFSQPLKRKYNSDVLVIQATIDF